MITSMDDKLPSCEIPGLGLEKEASFKPGVGSFVPVDMHPLLRQEFWNFEQGDLVALECGDSKDSVFIIVEIIRKVTCVDSSEAAMHGTYVINTGEDGEQTALATDLYKFAALLSISDMGALVLAAVPDQDDAADAGRKIEKLDIDAVIREIEERLFEARSLGEDQKQKVLKRLYLQWHPEKNPARLEVICGQIVKQIPELAGRIFFQTMSGDGENDEAEKDLLDGQAMVQGGFYNQSHVSSRYASCNLDSYDEVARRHRKQSGSFRQQLSSAGGSLSFMGLLNPQPQEARRWMRQAECDLLSAENDMMIQSYEWSCYKYHQAAEKSLKAFQFHRDANQHFTHILRSLCTGLTDTPVLGWVDRLERLISNPSAMRYPNRQNYPQIPHDVYGDQMTEEVRGIVTNIVTFIRRWIT